MKANKYQLYIENICNIIQTDSIFKNEIKNTSIIKNAIKKSKYSNSYSDCHQIIDEILIQLRELGDLHSKFKIYDPNLIKNYEDEDINIPPEVKVIKNCVYIKLHSFDGTDEKEIVEFSQKLHDKVSEISTQQLNGYIVDLRDNPGGNMDPMILGLGFLIEKNPCAFFNFPDGSNHSWGYVDGNYYYNNEVLFTLPKPYKLIKKLPIAILINEKTASSAEMLTVSLMDNNVKLFGNTTKNRTTGNAVYKLEDKSKLVLSTSKLVNLEGNDYLKGIVPDIKVTDKEALNEAIKWISEL